MGLLLVVVGIGLMCAGSGIFFYDSYFRRKNTDDLPTTMQLTETSTFGQAPSSSRGGQESLG